MFAPEQVAAPVPRRSRPLLHAALLVLLAGCAAPLDPTSHDSSQLGADRPDQSLARGGASTTEPITRRMLFPLDVGNRWTYERTDRTQIIPDVGPPSPPTIEQMPFEVTLPCAVEHDGLDYVVELETFPQIGSYYFYLYRQDSDELRALDVGRLAIPCDALPVTRVSAQRRNRPLDQVAVTIGDARRRAAYAAEIRRQQTRLDRIRNAVAGAERELVLLSYPLYTGKSWLGKVEGNFIFTVEGQDELSLPAGTFSALRIRIDSDFLAASDEAHVWYGPRGRVLFRAEFEGLATDAAGNVIGRVVSTSTEELMSYSLVGP